MLMCLLLITYIINIDLGNNFLYLKLFPAYILHLIINKSHLPGKSQDIALINLAIHTTPQESRIRETG